MKVSELIDHPDFTVINRGEDDREITVPFCCDLLSFAMARTPAGSAWVTVMGNVNTVAVAALTETACVILAEGAAFDALALEKAKSQGITVLGTKLPVFDAALTVYRKIHA